MDRNFYLKGCEWVVIALIIYTLAMACTSAGGVDDGGSTALSGDGIRGGQLYDHFWIIKQVNEIPEWVYTEHSTTMLRCKACHGWDYRGSQGIYGDNYNPKDFAIDFDLAGSRGQSPQVLASRIMDTSIHPDYSEILTDEDIDDLVTFISQNMVDTKQFFDFDSAEGYYKVQSGGDQNAGVDFINQNCIGCHGANADQIATDIGRYSLGSSMRIKYFETHHKVLYGAPGTNMKPIPTSPVNLLNMLAAFCDFDLFPSIYHDEDPTDLETISALQEVEQRACANYNDFSF